MVTFDQPLYKKAMEILLNYPEMRKSFVLMLGQFHIRKACLKSIGDVMTNSGLDAALKSAFAENTGLFPAFGVRKIKEVLEEEQPPQVKKKKVQK